MAEMECQSDPCFPRLRCHQQCGEPCSPPSCKKFVIFDRGEELIGAPKPAILPCKRNVLIVPTESDISASTIAELERLMFADRNGHRCTEARIGLQCCWR